MIISLSPASAQISVNQTQQFTATAKDAYGNIIPTVSFTWSSSAAAVASINSSGLASALTAGSAQITATAPNGIFSSATLTVSVPTGRYYVSPSGSDSNNCLSSGSPCLTIAHAEALSSAGDTISLAAGIYRLVTSPTGNTSTTGRITPKDNQTFTGPACTPTSGPCEAIVSGAISIGPIASGPDGSGSWSVSGQTQQGNAASYPCDPGWEACSLAEDLFWDGSPLQHVGYTLGGTISYSSGGGGTISGSGSCTTTTENSVLGNGGGYGAIGTISISSGTPTGNISLTYNPEAWASVPTKWVLSGGSGGATCSGSPLMTTTVGF